MSNPINDAIEEIGKSTVEMREKLDRIDEENKKGNAAREKELEIQAAKWNESIDLAQKELKRINLENEKYKARIEMLEALADRPRGNKEEEFKSKELKLWTKCVRSGFKDSKVEAELIEVRKQMAGMETKTDSVLSGTALQGGNDVPKIIADQIETLVLAQSDIYPRVNVVTAGSSDYNEIVTIAGANGGWAAEAGSRSQTNAPNFRKVTPTHGELFALPRVSNWALQDLQHDVLSIINQDAADTFAISISTAIHSGSGSSQPTGMVHSAPTASDDYASPMRAAAVFEYIATGDSPTSSPISIDDLIDLQATLRRPYRNGAEFAMNRTTMGAIRKLKDTNGAYYWQPSTQAGQPDMLLGDPVFIWEDMATQAAGALPVAYGNFRRAYTYIKIGAMTMIRDEVTVPGFTNFYIAQRAGGIPRNNDAVKFIKQAAS